MVGIGGPIRGKVDLRLVDGFGVDVGLAKVAEPTSGIGKVDLGGFSAATGFSATALARQTAPFGGVPSFLAMAKANAHLVPPELAISARALQTGGQNQASLDIGGSVSGNYFRRNSSASIQAMSADPGGDARMKLVELLGSGVAAAKGGANGFDAFSGFISEIIRIFAPLTREWLVGQRRRDSEIPQQLMTESGLEMLVSTLSRLERADYRLIPSAEHSSARSLAKALPEAASEIETMAVNMRYHRWLSFYLDRPFRNGNTILKFFGLPFEIVSLMRYLSYKLFMAIGDKEAALNILSQSIEASINRGGAGFFLLHALVWKQSRDTACQYLLLAKVLAEELGDSDTGQWLWGWGTYFDTSFCHDGFMDSYVFNDLEEGEALPGGVLF